MRVIDCFALVADIIEEMRPAGRAREKLAQLREFLRHKSQEIQQRDPKKKAARK